MVDFTVWPTKLLRPAQAMASEVAFTRTGGRSLGGLARPTKTDKGFWRISLVDVAVRSPGMRRTWNAISTYLNGMSGLVVVPVWSFDSAPYVSGQREYPLLTTHDDDTTFSDGTEYSQGAISIEMAATASLGATVVTLKAIHASSVWGIRFSYQHALYKTGPIISQPTSDTFVVPIFPAIRLEIPSGATLEVDNPTCLCHLADDRGMDLLLSNTEIDTASVEFVEAVDVWNDIALGIAA